MRLFYCSTSCCSNACEPDRQLAAASFVRARASILRALPVLVALAAAILALFALPAEAATAAPAARPVFWHVAIAYVVGFFVMLAILGWHPNAPHRKRVDLPSTPSIHMTLGNG